MWPSYEELDNTPDLEWALTQCYLEAFSRWIPQVLDVVLPEFGEGDADLPVDLDALTGAESMAIWQEQVDEIIAPAARLMWSVAYTDAMYALGARFDPPMPSMTASGEDYADWDELFNNPPPVDYADLPDWDITKETPYTPPPPKPKKSQEEITRSNREGLARAQARVTAPWYKRHKWVARVREMQRTFAENLGGWGGARPSDDRIDTETFSAVAPERSPRARTRLTRKNGEPTGLPYTPRQTPDMVAELTALAWNTKPDQVKMAALVVWDQVSSRRQLEMFLGSYTPKVAESVPGRVRDLLVGSTRRGARAAIPMDEFKDELGMWLSNVQPKYGGTPTGPWRERRKPLRKYDPAKENWPTHPDNVSWNDFYEREYVPLEPRPAMNYFQKFRELFDDQEVVGIINNAMLTAASQSDTDFDKVWCAHMDTRTRNTHFAADGQQVALDADFTVGGVTLSYPGDPAGPPREIRRCRCRVGMNSPGEPLPREQRRNSAQKNEIIHRRRQGVVRAREDEAGIGYVPPGITAAATTEENTMTDFRTFTDAAVAFIGTPTSDGRVLSSDIELSFRSFPLPLMWMKQSADGHTAAFTVGVIEAAERRDDTVVASGYLLNTSEADEAADQLAHGVTRPSVDLAAATWVATDGDGNEVAEGYDGPVFMTITEAELIGTTLVATPAFGDTALSLNDSRESRDVALVAAAADEFRPRVYDHHLFENPNLTEPTLPTMGDDGRIFGHLACFGQCHRSIQTECVIAPRSRSDYAHFHTSPAVRLDDGRRLPVGRLTVGTGHAHSGASPRAAAAHYDNTGTCFALVRVGEDAHGIWFSGVAAPWATAEQIEMGLSSPLSGDWRDFGQGLELVAALAVNTPGFAARGRSDEQGRPVALVASLGPTAVEDAAVPSPDFKAIVRAVLAAAEAERQAEQEAAEKQELLERASQITRPPTPNEEVAELLASVRR